MSTRTPQTFTIKSAGIDVLVTRKRIKNMNLRINREGKVLLSIPAWCTKSDAAAFLAREQDWIARSRAKVDKRVGPLMKERYREGEATMLWGEPYRLSFVPWERSVFRPDVDPACHAIELRLSSTLVEEANGARTIPKEAIDLMRRIELEKELPRLAAFAEERVGAHATEWHVRTMKTRWGSCSVKLGRICLNSELAAYPISCAEAVSCHEACHLLVPNHSEVFYKELGRACPGYREVRRLLREHPHLA